MVNISDFEEKKLIVAYSMTRNKKLRFFCVIFVKLWKWSYGMMLMAI